MHILKINSIKMHTYSCLGKQMKTVLGNQRGVGVPDQPYQGKVLFMPGRENTQKEPEIQGLEVCVGRGHCTKNGTNSVHIPPSF